MLLREDTDIEDRTIDSHVKRIRKNLKKLILIFQLLKQDMEVGIDGMLNNAWNFLKNLSILKKFLFINFSCFFNNYNINNSLFK